MQRVHQNDLVGYLQEQGGFEVLNLPAIAIIAWKAPAKARISSWKRCDAQGRPRPASGPRWAADASKTVCGSKPLWDSA
jgi:hypothetical protein